MKKLFNILLVGVSLLTVVYSCSEAEQPFYDGDSYLHFATSQSGDAYVTINSGNADFDVPYSVTKAVSGNHNVELVVDQANSTAVLGTDFTVSPSVLAEGAINGTVKVNVKEAAAAAGKKVVFKLSSSTLPVASFRNSYTLTFNLRCPISNFIGTGVFKNTTAYWMAPAGTDYIVENVTSGTTPQFKIKGYMDDGSDLVVNYNPDTYAITIPTQPTGYAIAQGNVYAGDPSTGAKSTFNPCTRVLTLYVYWHVRNSAGNIVAHYNGGNPALEVFTGQ